MKTRCRLTNSYLARQLDITKKVNPNSILTHCTSGKCIIFCKTFFSRWHRTCNLGEWLCDRRRTDRTCTKNYSPNDGEKNHFEEFRVWLKKIAFTQTWVPALKLTVCHRKSMLARWNVLLRMAYVTLGSGSVIFDTPRKLTCPLNINGWFRSIFLFKNSSFLGDQFVHFRRQKLMFQLMIWTATVKSRLFWDCIWDDDDWWSIGGVTERETKWVEFRGKRQAQVPLDPCSRSSREASFRRDPTTGDVACYLHCPQKRVTSTMQQHRNFMKKMVSWSEVVKRTSLCPTVGQLVFFFDFETVIRIRVSFCGKSDSENTKKIALIAFPILFGKTFWLSHRF